MEIAKTWSSSIACSLLKAPNPKWINFPKLQIPLFNVLKKPLSNSTFSYQYVNIIIGNWRLNLLWLRAVVCISRELTLCDYVITSLINSPQMQQGEIGCWSMVRVTMLTLTNIISWLKSHNLLFVRRMHVDTSLRNSSPNRIVISNTPQVLAHTNQHQQASNVTVTQDGEQHIVRQCVEILWAC